MTARVPIEDAIAQLAGAVNAPQDPEAQLDTLVRVAQDSMPEIDHAGISVAYRDGRVETKAATSELVHQLDQMQYSLGEGPCLHAIGSEPVVIVQEHAVRPDGRASWRPQSNSACGRCWGCASISTTRPAAV